ncbi:MAG: hypothetical protein KKE62_03720 [Proteobacteria bacterium]|nr:hypothetical protein [Pseudomonadota bacterium]MBU1387481.1 hypothetical protein [Pseudomonadota bacterium]MBU1541932.1 hypothetical protein [Pseudomonadota bacterium]MBU2429766.1 hypothetical protein [Pseudomonadota bacterium]MBU2481919.1 hypothetical protein [Pseudomonadota bacterium]
MKNQTTDRSFDHYCTAQEQKHLISEMTYCDQAIRNSKDRYECYLNAVKESRENKACMYS